MNGKKEFGFLSGNLLKIIACITMAVDHAGVLLFPRVTALRIIGRIAFPIFAFFIAEGCRYTRNRLKHFLLIFLLGLIYVAGELLFYGQADINIFLTFSASIIIIYSMDYLKGCCFKAEPKASEVIIAAASFLIITAAVVASTFFLEYDYGIVGIMCPVAVSLLSAGKNCNNTLLSKLDNRYLKVLLLAVMLALLSLSLNSKIQYYSLIAIPLLLLYNGRRGRFNLKYAFYVFYPLHMAVIYVIYAAMHSISIFG